MTIGEALSKRVDELLELNNITQYRLSMLSGVSQGSISDIRHQRHTEISIKMIYELAQGFGMDLPDFFDSPLFRNGNIMD